MKRFGGMAVAGVLGAITLAAGAQPALNITQHHNHLSRDGLYLEPAFTKTAVAGLKRDLSFDGRISGDVYAQPLYLEGGPGGKAMIMRLLY